MEYRVSSTDAAAAPEASVAVAAAAAAAVAAAAAALNEEERYHETSHNLNIGYYNSSVIEYTYYCFKLYLSVCNCFKFPRYIIGLHA